jgi:hypothetical protein
LAVLEQFLACFFLLEVCVAVLADPCDEVTTRGKRSSPLISKEVVIAVLQLETHLTLLL